jgi:hypothetical protein
MAKKLRLGEIYQNYVDKCLIWRDGFWWFVVENQWIIDSSEVKQYQNC